MSDRVGDVWRHEFWSLLMHGQGPICSNIYNSMQLHIEWLHVTVLQLQWWTYIYSTNVHLLHIHVHVFNVFYMFQYDYVIIKNTTNIFTSLYYILQSITLSVLHITVTSTNETISKFTSTIKHVSISPSGMLIMVSITRKIYRNFMYFLCRVNYLQYIYTYIHLWFIRCMHYVTITHAYCYYSIHFTCCDVYQFYSQIKLINVFAR